MTFVRRSSGEGDQGERPPRVLVVEDEPDILELLADTLSLEGFQVRTTEEAQGILSLIRRTDPDLIILDLRLPGISGIQLLPLLATDAPDIPVLISTGSRDLVQEYADEIRRLGAVVLEKPFSLDEFLSAVDKAMARSRHRSGRR